MSRQHLPRPTRLRRALALLPVLLAGLPAPAVGQSACTDAPLAVQVLGSGGPLAGSARASSGYLVWSGGRPVLMVDAGGGTFVRFGEAGARLADLSVLAISHLHPDHVSDLPGLLWVSDALRDGPLTLVGPSAGGVFPDMATFVHRLFDGSTGAFPILAGTLGQPGRGARLDVRVVDVSAPASVVFRGEDGLVIRAVGVPHASADVSDATTPSVAYRVERAGRSVVFSSDQNGSDERFVGFAAETDLLVMHFAVSEQNEGLIHAKPSVVGRIARDARVGRLLLSHVMETPPGFARPQAFTGATLAESTAVVRGLYGGPLEVATDLKCVVVG